MLEGRAQAAAAKFLPCHFGLGDPQAARGRERRRMNFRDEKMGTPKS